jgi:dihydrofolate reductase
MRGMLFAVSPEGVIGVGGRIPWHYAGDFRRFRRLTLGTTLIMGRKTYESIGHPLPGRRNIVVTSRPLEGVECVPTLDEAVARAGDAIDVWFIGGARIYEEAMRYADIIDVVYVPDRIDAPDAVRAPAIDETWEGGPVVQHEDEPTLKRRVFTRRAP